MTTEGAQPQVPLDASDQAAMAREQVQMAGESVFGGLVPGFGAASAASHMAQIAQIQGRANKKAELAQAAGAGTRMRVDPAQVDALARFFEDEAQGLLERELAVQKLAEIKPPGTDPVSKGAVKAYGQVGAGDAQAYLDNYHKLAEVFQATAANLRSAAKQTRSDDQNAADSFRGGTRA